MGRRVGYWKTHPKKELQEVLLRFDDQGWRIDNPPKYYKAYCPCSEKHKHTIHLSPSNPNYGKDLLRWLQRQPCYDKTKDGAR